MMGWCGARRVGGWCCLLVIVYVTSQLVEVCDAQAYHFSKGWMPGRKRSNSQLTGEPGELDRRSAAEACAIKSQSYRLAVDILKVHDCSYSLTLLRTEERLER